MTLSLSVAQRNNIYFSGGQLRTVAQLSRDHVHIFTGLLNVKHSSKQCHTQDDTLLCNRATDSGVTMGVFDFMQRRRRLQPG